MKRGGAWMDFQEVYNLYFRDVYKFVLSLCKNPALAEEITQETFFKVLNNIDSFRGQCKLYVWLCQIAKNTYYTHLAKTNREKSPFKVTDQDCIEERFLDRETAFEIHKALHMLPEPYKEVFSLRTFGELSFKQIGSLFEKTESWARVTYHRAKLKIREEIK